MAESTSKMSGPHMDLFLWLQHWEQILTLSSKSGRNLHISELLGKTGFWSWVPQWPESEMELFLKTLSDIKIFIKILSKNCNRYQVKTLQNLSDGNWSLKDCLAQWQKRPDITQSILHMLAKPEDCPIINQENTTYVVKIQLQAQKIKVHIWMQRWNRLMQMINDGNDPRASVDELQLDTWKTDWEDDPMTFLCDSLQKFQELILPAKDCQKTTQQRTFTLPNKGFNLYGIACAWVEDKTHINKMMAWFSDSDETGSGGLQTDQKMNTSTSESIAQKMPDSQKLADNMQINEMFGSKQGRNSVKTAAKAQTGNERPHTPQGFHHGRTMQEHHGEKQRQIPGTAWPDPAKLQNCPRETSSRTEVRHQNWVHDSDPLSIGPNARSGDAETQDIIKQLQQTVDEKDKEINFWKGQYNALKEEKANNNQRRSLQRTVSSYGERKPSEYNEVARKKICQLEESITERDETISTLRATNDQLQADVQRYSTDLSRMMQRELSRDESALENISLKHRPMTIAEQYAEIQTGQWLAAKEALDQYAEDCLTEQQRMEFLMDLMMNCFNTMKVMHQSQREQLQRVLDNPMKVQSLVPTEPSAVKPEIRLTSQLQEAIARYLKIQCGTMDFRDFSKGMVEDLTQQLKGLKYDETKNIKSSRRIQEFCSIFASLAWKMVVQTPPMDFDQGDVGKPFNDAKHEPHWGSMKENEKGVMILYYVYPTLYHNKQVMVKGRVFLGKPEKIRPKTAKF